MKRKNIKEEKNDKKTKKHRKITSSICFFFTLPNTCLTVFDFFSIASVTIIYVILLR
jgi:hypothetical protein